MRLVACLLTGLLACGGNGARAGERLAPQVARIAVHEASGADAGMVVHWFLPPGPGPFPVVVYSHGRDPSAAGRARVRLGVNPAQVLFWRARGVAVVTPVRPGYGASGGADLEDPGLRIDAAGRCVGRPGFAREADAAAQAVAATLAWLRDQPWADAGQVLLEGQSAGGLATAAAAARDLPGVVGYVNFAGGAGGNPERAPGDSCDPEQLAALYADYGRTTAVPSLWVYALNDRYWGADAPREWHAAFARGGSPTRFVQLPPVAGSDGHQLAAHPATLWAPAVDTFLATLGPPWNAATAPRPVLRLDPG